MNAAKFFVSVLRCQPFPVRSLSADVRTLADISERVVGPCITAVVQFVQERVADSPWRPCIKFGVGVSPGTCEPVAGDLAIADAHLGGLRRVLFVSFQETPPITEDETIRVAQSAMPVAMLPNLKSVHTSIHHLRVLLAFRGCPVERVEAMQRHELVANLCSGKYPYTHVVRIKARRAERVVAVLRSDEHHDFLSIVSHEFPTLRGGCIFTCATTGVELADMTDVRACGSICVTEQRRSAAAAAAPAPGPPQSPPPPPPQSPESPSSAAAHAAAAPAAAPAPGPLPGPPQFPESPSSAAAAFLAGPSVLARPPPSSLYCAAVRAPFSCSSSLVAMLLTGVATTALFSNNLHALNRLIGTAGTMRCALRWVHPEDHKALLASADAFYGLVAGHRAAVARGDSQLDVTFSLLRGLLADLVAFKSLARLFLLASFELLYRNATWTSCAADKSVQTLLEEEFGIPAQELVMRMAEMASNEHALFPQCLFSKMASVMGFTFRVVAPDGSAQSHVCASSPCVDVSIARVSEGQFALLVPSAARVPLTEREEAERQHLQRVAGPSVQMPVHVPAPAAADGTAALVRDLAQAREQNAALQAQLAALTKTLQDALHRC